VLVWIAKTAAAAGDLDRAERVARSVTVSDLRATALRYVAEVAASGDVLGAERIARSITAFGQADGALADVAGAAAAAGDLAGAERVARSIGNPYVRDRALVSIAGAAATAGELNHAWEILPSDQPAAGRLVNPFMDQDALGDFAAAAAAAGDFDGVTRLLRRITFPGQSTRAYAMIVRAVANGDPEHAERIAHSLADPNTLVEALTCVAEVVATAGDVVRAEQITESIVNVNQRDRALVRIVTAAAAANVAGAERVANSIVNPDHKVEALTRLTNAMAATGDVEETERIARLITDPDRQATALLNLTQTCPHQRRLRVVVHALRTTAWYRSLRGAIELAPPTILTAIEDELTALSVHHSQSQSWRL
jgi:hypothetical protein